MVRLPFALAACAAILLPMALSRDFTCCGDGPASCATLPEPCDCSKFCLPLADQGLQRSKTLPNVALLGDSIARLHHSNEVSRG